VYLFDKGNLEAIKEEIIQFQDSFINSDPYNKSVEENWLSFKSFILQTIHPYIPQKSVKQQKNWPWLTRDINQDMHRRKRLYKRAKQTNSHNHWDAYRNIEILSIKNLGKLTLNSLFDNSFAGDRRQFWKYIRSRRKKMWHTILVHWWNSIQ